MADNEKSSLQDICLDCGRKRSVHRFDLGCEFRSSPIGESTARPIALDYGVSPREARKAANAESALRVALRKASEKAEGDNAVKAWREAREKLPFDCRFGFRFCSSRFRCGGCQPYSLCSVGAGERR